MLNQIMEKPFFSLSNLKTYSFTDSEISKMKDQLKGRSFFKRKSLFSFCLAQGCESKGEYDEAFYQLI